MCQKLGENHVWPLGSIYPLGGGAVDTGGYIPFSIRVNWNRFSCVGFKGDKCTIFQHHTEFKQINCTMKHTISLCDKH